MLNSFVKKLIKMVKVVIRYGLIVINDGLIWLPVKKGIVIFDSFNGRDINDNPAAIYRQLIHDDPSFAQTAFFAVKPDKYQALHAQYPEIKLLKRFMPKWIWYMARAEFWVFNSRMPAWWKKNYRTCYIQTWHGTPLKKLGIDINNVEMPGTDTNRYHRRFIAETKRWDYLIAPNQYSKDIFKRAFQFHNQFLDIGYPRNDILYADNNKQQINKLKQQLIGNVNQTVITYAPTWRDDQYVTRGQYKFDLPFDLKRFFQVVPNDTMLIIRPHYLIKDHINIEGFENRVKILADEDISSIYLITDLLITDYSSVMFDFANLNRPMLFYSYDLQHYRDQLRGFYFDYQSQLPGPLTINQQQFFKQLELYSQTGTFKNEYDKMKMFRKRFCSWESADSAEQVVKIIRGGIYE
ncbi:CDP-glycerol glycerophosphotransferase family protein [Nicoliella spurrieriana]|uniref:CDP-glycerol glycerophosphotransferase family protein n=1 Tax=Nicoliella spurrieriana TaxID=2925830 RepID=A0A976X508_9LACO|nr:CDP-glycerol glycerophosphotransferase family protein [Nicoliella spurrieriana]UQS86533.1 CDP-glycerol glycerophosphotransferase family protein [Nicoliella spurrieriana]